MSVSSRYLPQSHRLRLAVLAAVAISLFVPLVARLWYLQVIKETAFVERAADNTTETIIELAHSIGALTLAEGVETEELLRELVKLHCDEGQGYYFSPPLPFEKLMELLKKGVYFH